MGVLTEADMESGYRSAMQECALVMSLQMFNLILERCANLFPEPINTFPAPPSQPLELSEDLQTLLPAVKV
jgi:protein SMG6